LVTFASGSTPAGIPLAETLNPTPYFLRGDGTADILGNAGVSTASVGITACGGGIPAGSTSVCAHTGIFGVDLMVLDAQYGDRATSATVGTVYQGLDAQIYVATAVAAGVSPGTGASGIVVCEWDGITVAVGCPAAAPDGGAENVFIDAIDTRSGLDNPTALTQKIVRANAAGTANCLAFGTYAMATILADNYVQGLGQQLDCGLLAGGRVGEYTWMGYVSDRAGNARLANSALTPPLTGTLTALRVAIDEALPNITGIGFQVGLYTGGAAAVYSFSANDDLELWNAQVQLTYADATAMGGGVVMNPYVRYPYGSTAYTTGTFGTPFDGTFTNVVNGAPLTLGYYIVRWDFATTAAFVPGAGATGNVAAFTSSRLNNGVTANVRDVAAQAAAVPLVAPVLTTQLSDRVGGAAGAPGYGVMIDFRIMVKSGANAITVQDAAASSVTAPFCDRIDIFEVVDDLGGGNVPPVGGPPVGGVPNPAFGASAMTANDPALATGAGDGLVYRSTIGTAPVLTDNGFQRFFTYTSAVHTNIGTGLYVAACVKSGSALLSPIF
jgi:hypothetical protein